jgi:hypothetical protein
VGDHFTYAKRTFVDRRERDQMILLGSAPSSQDQSGRVAKNARGIGTTLLSPPRGSARSGAMRL